MLRLVGAVDAGRYFSRIPSMRAVDSPERDMGLDREQGLGMDQWPTGDVVDSRCLYPWGAGGACVELLVQRPANPEPRSGVLLVHGHQRDGERFGAEWAVRTGNLQAVVDAGFVAAAVSMPGYGQSAGPPDFCGPKTQAAVRAALGHLRTLPEVRADRLGLCGWSRGAIVSSLVAADEPGLAAVVLASGVYDFFDPRVFVVREIEPVFIAETGGGGPEEKEARSALLQAERIMPPTLFLHGAEDDRIHAGQADLLHRRLVALQRQSRMVLYPDTKHSLPPTHLHDTVIPFLKEMLFESPLSVGSEAWSSPMRPRSDHGWPKGGDPTQQHSPVQ